jgi:hypothetical protein
VGTISYLPALFGCYLASYCIQKLIKPWYTLPVLPKVLDRFKF